MGEARIILAEDLPAKHKLVELSLVDTPHKIVRWIWNIGLLGTCIEELLTKQLFANVLVLDGNLKANRHQGHDARLIVEAFRAADITLPTIGYSEHPLPPDLVDIDLGKGNEERLPAILDQLELPSLGHEQP